MTDPLTELLEKPWPLPEPINADDYWREAMADADDPLEEPPEDLG